MLTHRFDKNILLFLFGTKILLLFLLTPLIPSWRSKKRSSLGLFCCKRVSWLFSPIITFWRLVLWFLTCRTRTSTHGKAMLRWSHMKTLLTLLAAICKRTKLKFFSCWTWGGCSSFLTITFQIHVNKFEWVLLEKRNMKPCIYYWFCLFVFASLLEII